MLPPSIGGRGIWGRAARRFGVPILLLALSSGLSLAEPTLGRKSASASFGSAAISQLIASALRHDSRGVERALIGGADINAIGASGITPLEWVELSGDEASMVMLLEHGANPDLFKPLESGEVGLQPPLWIAIDKSNTKALEVLLRHKANPNLEFGNLTPLMLAVQEDHLECAELLLKFGADINAKVGVSNALTRSMTRANFKAALWVLRHGFTRDLETSRKWLTTSDPWGFGQHEAKAEALALIEERIKAQAVTPTPDANN